MESPFEIYLAATPGLEDAVHAEAKAAGFAGAARVEGGVRFDGGWADVWRANLTLRGAGRVLARLGTFRAAHLAQLDRRAREFPWAKALRRDVPVRVEASCKRSRIYHSGAAAQRVATAIAEELGAPVTDAAELTIKVRIENDVVTLSVDTSGGLLHKRGSKEAMAKAPMRETMAAMLLGLCGYDGREPVLDPFCGSGTFVIEAAEIAAGLMPGRARAFAFEQLASFDAGAWAALRAAKAPVTPRFTFHGSDRDAGAISAGRANAIRAGVDGFTVFEQKAVSDITPPEGPPGLVIMNPPYGARIGGRRSLAALYGAAGKTLMERFPGWRAGLVTADAGLARATGLPFKPASPGILHGGLRVRLYQTERLGPRHGGW